MKKNFFILIILINFICILLVGCANRILQYEIINMSSGAPLLANDYKTQMFKYDSFEEFKTGIAKYYKVNDTSEDISLINEELFTSALLVHVVVYHTSSDVIKIKNISKKDNLISIEINVNYSDGQTEDEIFTHYFVKIDRVELNSDTELILKGNYKI